MPASNSTRGIVRRIQLSYVPVKGLRSSIAIADGRYSSSNPGTSQMAVEMKKSLWNVCMDFGSTCFHGPSELADTVIHVRFQIEVVEAENSDAILACSWRR